MNLLMWRR